MTKEAHKTEKGVFDRFTIDTLRKLEGQGFFVVESLMPLFIGKESNVFIGEGRQGKIIVKVYRLENAEFLNMYSYLRGDPRLHRIKRKRRDIIFTWVRREYRNLLKAREGGVAVPTVYVVKNNVLVMQLIGDPADKVKDAPPKHPEAFYKKLIGEMKKLHKAGLVHADLSKFNILNFRENPVLIDFSQSTILKHPHAREYLTRDIKNVNTYFKKLGVKALKSMEDFS